MPPTCTAARRAAPSAVAVKDRTPKGGPLPNHLPRPGTLSKPLRRSGFPFGGMRTITASSIPPPNIMPSTDVMDCRLIPDVATRDHIPLAPRRQISCPSTTARQVPPTSGATAETCRPASSVLPSPASVNARHPEPVATRITSIDGRLYCNGPGFSIERYKAAKATGGTDSFYLQWSDGGMVRLKDRLAMGANPRCGHCSARRRAFIYSAGYATYWRACSRANAFRAGAKSGRSFRACWYCAIASGTRPTCARAVPRLACASA